MLNKVEVRNSQGAVLSLPLFDSSGGYAVTDIDGTDPVRASIVTSTIAGIDGNTYQSSRRDSRNIVIKLDIVPDYVTNDAKILRDNLYKYFMPKSNVTLTFFDTDGSTVEISGRVEDLDSPKFVKEPFADISIICFDPDFLATTPTVFSGNSSSNPNTFSTLNYEGTSDTGVIFTFTAPRSLTGFTLSVKTPSNITQLLTYSQVINSGDIIHISSVTRDKYAIQIRSSVESSVLNGVSPTSIFPVLEAGNNEIRVTIDGAAIPYTITYNRRYGAI